MYKKFIKSEINIAKKAISYIYMFLLFFILLIVIFCFYIWNNPFSILSLLQGEHLNNITIEQCEIYSKYIFIKGWGYIPNKQHSFTLLYVEKKDGQLLSVQTKTENRPDIQDPFPNPFSYNTLGFSGSKRLLWPQVFTKKIIIVKKSEDKKNYFTQYKCQ